MILYVADAHARVQRFVLVLKMTTVVQCITEEQHSVVRFCWAKGLSAKDIHTEMFHVYGGKCLSRKEVRNWVADVFAADEEIETEVWKWLRQQSKDLYAAGFDARVKR
jgi:hypothetical protein